MPALARLWKQLGQVGAIEMVMVRVRHGRRSDPRHLNHAAWLDHSAETLEDVRPGQSVRDAGYHALRVVDHLLAAEVKPLVDQETHYGVGALQVLGCSHKAAPHLLDLEVVLVTVPHGETEEVRKV